MYVPYKCNIHYMGQVTMYRLHRDVDSDIVPILREHISKTRNIEKKNIRIKKISNKNNLDKIDGINIVAVEVNWGRGLPRIYSIEYIHSK